jgi:hypothetical protein
LLSVLLTLAVLPALRAPAQSPDRLIACSDNAVFEVTPAGTLVNTLVNLPVGTYIEQVTPALDNRSLMMLALHTAGGSNEYRLTEVSPTGSLRTLTGVSFPGTTPLGLFPDDDGDWILVTRNLTFYRLSGGVFRPLTKVVGPLCTGSVLSQDTGRLVVRGQDLLTPTLTGGIYAVDYQAGGYTTVASLNPRTFGVRDLVYEGTTGAVVDADIPISMPPNQPRASLVRAVPSVGAVAFPRNGLVDYPAAIVPAGPRASGVAYHVLERDRSVVPQATRLTRLRADGSRLGSVVIQGFPTNASFLRMIRQGSRHLAWVMDAGPNDRSLRVSFPGEGHRPYRVALSVTGIRPGPRLPDGRVIPLRVDSLVRLCLAGGVPGILENTAGVLDARGEARVKVHLNGLGRALRGIRLWAAALVLDSDAPCGVAAIAGPLLLTVK